MSRTAATKLLGVLWLVTKPLSYKAAADGPVIGLGLRHQVCDVELDMVMDIASQVCHRRETRSSGISADVSWSLIANSGGAL